MPSEVAKSEARSDCCQLTQTYWLVVNFLCKMAVGELRQGKPYRTVYRSDNHPCFAILSGSMPRDFSQTLCNLPAIMGPAEVVKIQFTNGTRCPRTKHPKL